MAQSAPRRINPIYIALAFLAIAVAFGAWTLSAEKTAGPALTNEMALSALKSELFDECLPEGVAENYKSCTVEVAREGESEIWQVKVTYDGLHDDSIRASRVEARVSNVDGYWTASDVRHSTQCQVGRGHQEFGTELCV